MRFFLIPIISLLLLAACTRASPSPFISPSLPPPSATPNPTHSPSPTFITSTVTVTPSSSPTPRPPSPTPTPTICLGPPEIHPVPTRSTPLEVGWISNGDIWLWHEASGKSWQVTSIGDVRTFTISEDGQVIVFKRSADPYQSSMPYTEELWAVNQDGSDIRRLLSSGQIAAFGSESHPDYIGNSVAFSGWETGTHRLILNVGGIINAIGGGFTSYGYWIIDVDSGNLTPTDPPLIEDPTLSPDGNYRYILGNTSLAICLADGSACREDVITYPSGPYEGNAWWYGTTLAWSPDSQSLKAIFPSPDFEESSDIGYLTAYQIPMDPSLPLLSAEFEAGPFESYLSPDQQYLLFWRPIKSFSNTRELHLAAFDGSQDEIYAVGNPLEIHGWAPDGVHFVYWVKGKAWYGTLCGAATPLTDVPYAHTFSWVDGQRYLFVESQPDDPQGVLRLGILNASSIVLGPFNGESAYYQANQDLP